MVTFARIFFTEFFHLCDTLPLIIIIGEWPLYCRFMIMNSNILGGGALFSKLNDLISGARASFLQLTIARLVQCTVYVSIIGNLRYHYDVMGVKLSTKWRKYKQTCALM